MPFSYTAPVFSKEDQERELADLSAEEKEDILNDAFGRNADEVTSRNEREITQQELDDFDQALEHLPTDEKCEAAAAAVMCPDLIQTETNPTMFLRCENYDPQEAAKRFATYWNFRVELLGNEKAFLPITLSEGGAYHEDEEILQMMRESPTYRAVLPNDSKGRSVLFIESDQANIATERFSREMKIKYHFYILHRLLKKESSISRGLVVVADLHDSKGKYALNKFDRIKVKKIMKLGECVPIKLRAYHTISSKSSLVTTMLFPVAMFLAKNEMRQRIFHHYQNGSQSVFDLLEQYGFKKEGLPERHGGTYVFNTAWVQEHLTVDQD